MNPEDRPGIDEPDRPIIVWTAALYKVLFQANAREDDDFQSDRFTREGIAELIEDTEARVNAMRERDLKKRMHE
jgi:hypothetical protein